MIKKLWKQCAYRFFSRSSSRRNQLPKSTEPMQENPERVVQLDAIPKNWEKKLLVWTGKFKSLEEVPTRVSFDTMSKAKSIIRIRIANYSTILILLLCFIYAYTGKQMAKGGDSIMKRVLERDERVKAEGRTDAEARSKAQAQAQAQA